jgi:hypothetical protein
MKKEMIEKRLVIQKLAAPLQLHKHPMPYYDFNLSINGDLIYYLNVKNVQESDNLENET